MPPVHLLPHLLVGKQLLPAGVQAGRSQTLAALRHPASDTHHGRCLARRAGTLPPSSSAVQDAGRLPARNRLVWQRKPGRAPQDGHNSSSHRRRSLIPRLRQSASGPAEDGYEDAVGCGACRPRAKLSAVPDGMSTSWRRKRRRPVVGPSGRRGRVPPHDGTERTSQGQQRRAGNGP